MEKPFDVIYEDNHLLIVNKVSGLLVQGDKTGDRCLADYAKEYIKEKYDKPGAVYLGLPHRIDRPVSGLVILARTSKALERMNEIFRTRDIQKTYWAVVRRRPPEKQGKLVHWLIKDNAKNQVTAYDYPHPEGQKAELKYRILGKMNELWLLEVNPITGRPHQIRVQLAKMGCPIRGDVKYGYPRGNPEGDINLHARKVYFEHPVKKEKMICVASVPQTAFWEEFLEFDDLRSKEKNMENWYEG